MLVRELITLLKERDPESHVIVLVSVHHAREVIDKNRMWIRIVVICVCVLTCLTVVVTTCKKIAIVYCDSVLYFFKILSQSTGIGAI